MSNIHFVKEGHVGQLWLDNLKKLNALTPEMMSQLMSHCDTIEHDSDILGVLLCAKGDRAFCVGADIGAWSKLSAAEFSRHWVRDGHRIFDRLARLSKPTIAAINSHAFGGGLELVAACDMRIMAPNATLALPEAGIGIVPAWSGTQRLTRLIGEPCVKEMALFGRKISAGRAHDLGFVTEISDDPMKAAMKLMNELSSISSYSIEVAKYMIHAAVGEDRAAMTDALAGGMMASADDKREGVHAFLEKRMPKFTGK